MEFDTISLGLCILLGGVVSLIGKALVETVRVPRIVWWTGILMPFAVTHLTLLHALPFARMVGLCIVLLMGMKVITYMEWIIGGGKRMSWVRWGAFSFLWFGMQPMAWVGRRKRIGQLEWRSHVVYALIPMIIGAVGLSFYAGLGLDYFPASFICMSMMFHYGVLRLNTALWRIIGFPVRTLFRNPLVTSGFGDFWGARWNLAYSQMMARAVQKPLLPQIGKKGATFAVFLVSGLFHEFAISVVALDGFGLPFLFFLAHGVVVLVEKKHWSMRYLCLGSLVIGLPILFPPAFVEGIVMPVEEYWREAMRWFFSLIRET